MSFQLKISEKDARRVQTLASLFKIDSILIASKRPGRPRGSTNKSKLKPAKSPTFLEPEPHTDAFDEESNFARSDLRVGDRKRLKRTLVNRKFEPSDGAPPEKSERREIYNIRDEDSVKDPPRLSQTPNQDPTYAKSQIKYPFQFEDTVVSTPSSTSNSRDGSKGGTLVSQSSNSLPCYVASPCKYQDTVVPEVFKAIPSTSNSETQIQTIQNCSVKSANDISPNDFSKNKFLQ